MIRHRTDRTASAEQWNRIVDRSRQIQCADGFAVRGPHGTILAPPAPQVYATASNPILYYFLFVGPVTTVAVGCHSWTPGVGTGSRAGTIGEDLIYVAFPFDMRPTLYPGAVLPVEGKVTYDYSGIASQQRTRTIVDSSPLDVVTQRITPALCLADATDPDTYPASIVTAERGYTGCSVDGVSVEYIMKDMTIHWGNT